LPSEVALQQEILTPVVDEACADEALAAPELSLAKYEIVPDDATSLESEFESKQQEILEPLPAVDGGLSEYPLIHPGSPTTGNSMTELAPCPAPLPAPLLEALSSEYKSDSSHLPRIRRRVRRSLKRERKAKREAAEVVTAADATAEASTQHHPDLGTPDWCLVVRGRGHGRR
jgi:hypothetical protein